MKKRLLDGESIELTNEESHILLWFSKHPGHFCLFLNGKCIKSTKTWGPIESKLSEFGELTEIED